MIAAPIKRYLRYWLWRRDVKELRTLDSPFWILAIRLSKLYLRSRTAPCQGKMMDRRWSWPSVMFCRTAQGYTPVIVVQLARWRNYGLHTTKDDCSHGYILTELRDRIWKGVTVRENYSGSLKKLVARATRNGLVRPKCWKGGTCDATR